MTNTLNGYEFHSDVRTPEIVCEDVLAFKERAGKPGGGKGILIGRNKTFTISTEQRDSICYAVSTDGKSKADTTQEVVPTLTVTKKSKCAAVCYENRNVVAAFGGTGSNAAITDGTVAPCILARAGTGGGNEPMIVIDRTKYDDGYRD